VGLIVFSNSKADLEKQITNQLLSVSAALEKNINGFIDGQENKLEIIATQNDLSNEELNKMVNLDPSFYQLAVLDPNGTIIASSDRTGIGSNQSTNPYFFNARNKTYIRPAFFSDLTQRHSFTISVPFHGGVLVGRMDLSYFETITKDKTGLGETGESLLAYTNEKGEIVYFSTRRFSNNTFEILSKEEAFARPIYSATQGEEGLLIGSKDYRGVVVIASANFIEKLNLGLVSKIDEAEAFAPIYRLQKLILIITIITIFLISFIVYFVARDVSLEIKKVTKDIEEITKGNLEIQLKRSDINEIESLVDSLNRILASMKLAILRTSLGKEELGLGQETTHKEKKEKVTKIREVTLKDKKSKRD